MADLHTGYLTGRQLSIWDMMRDGLSQSEIARILNVSRQAINQLVETIPEKITAALNDAAKLNRIEPRHIDASKGILFGWSRDFQTEAVMALNPTGGLQVWYQHTLGKCKICPDRRRCKSTLLRIATDVGVSLKREERKLDPSKLSTVIFSKVTGHEDKQSRYAS